MEKKLKSKETDMLRSIGKQSAESVQSVLKKRKKATVGRICRKGRLKRLDVLRKFCSGVRTIEYIISKLFIVA